MYFYRGEFMKTYGDFANIYDSLMRDFDYEKWFHYIEEIYKKYEKTPKTLLEMACGTGNLSYHLGRANYKLTCFDLSQEMLTEAYKKLRTFKNVRILNQDMVDFKLSSTFDSVLAVCDSINYITEEGDLARAFKNVWNHLEENGIFIFDINSRYKLKNIIGNNNFIEESEGIFYTWQNFYEEDTNINNFYLSFFQTEDGETYKRFDEDHRQRAYSLDEILEALKEAGFTRIDYYEAFGFEEIKENTERINFVAIK